MATAPCQSYAIADKKSENKKLIIVKHHEFVKIRDEIASNIERLQKTASVIANIDVLASLATVAENNNYVCPEIDDSGIIDIEDGRHPVVEKMLGQRKFCAK